jgi:hypothetical protein
MTGCFANRGINFQDDCSKTLLPKLARDEVTTSRAAGWELQNLSICQDKMSKLLRKLLLNGAETYMQSRSFIH